MPMMFSTVPFICEPLLYYTKQCYNHLANLELADSSRVGEELQIDALIGLDHLLAASDRVDHTGR